MKFNTKEINKFIKYYKYFIILRNVLSNYYKIDIKNIKLESIKIDNIYLLIGIKCLNIKYIINNNITNIMLQIKPEIFAGYISNFPKIKYEFSYNLIKNNNYISINNNCIYKKYFSLDYGLINLNKYIISKNFILKNSDTILMKYYYDLNIYKIYIIYIRKKNIFVDIDESNNFIEYSYISKIFI